mmetsp:Transcript_96782/g.166868  ORF Transcript_96782/g.166868 Transcript_96782/m.166868 type:complete len:199 (-) Transcript_96782:544-1140(-)
MKMGARVWKCGCGKFTATLSGEPFLEFNCHCRFCVAPARYLNEKYPNGTSALVNKGVGKSLFYLKDVTLAASNPPLKYLRVGPEGTNIRSFTSCCGTLFNSAGGAGFPLKGGRPITRNCIYQADGSPYGCGPKPDGETALAFDTDVREKGDTPGLDFSPFMVAAQATAGDNPADYDHSCGTWYKTPDAETTVVPITWE